MPKKIQSGLNDESIRNAILSVWFQGNNKLTFKVSFLATSSSRNEAHFAAGEALEEAAGEIED